MWSWTIRGALRGMLADRQLDIELEKIERKVLAEHGAGPSAAGRGTTDG